jgi:hypothetical protein
VRRVENEKKQKLTLKHDEIHGVGGNSHDVLSIEALHLLSCQRRTTKKFGNRITKIG